MLKEIYSKEAITLEYPPDGGTIPIIDPYDGCTMGCPYCFQMNDTNWNKDLIVKLNMPQLIKEQLKNWDI
jgi:DNA repair photolyase